MGTIRMMVLFAGLTTPSIAMAGNVTISQHTRTYPASGGTIQAIVKSMKRNGPMSELHGRRALGMADYRYNTRVQTVQKGGLCRVSSAHVSMRIFYVLPKLTRRDSLSKSHFARWLKISSMIGRHERQHGRLYQQFARQLQSALSKMKPQKQCFTLKSQERQISKRLEQANINRNRRYDRAQYKPFNRRLKALAPK